MLLFLDVPRRKSPWGTEFSGLQQRRPQLISIGLISADGDHVFYAELPTESYVDAIDPWVKTNVLPLLDGGASILEPDALRQHLAAFFARFKAEKIVQIACDAKDFDMAFLRGLLDPWPENLDRRPYPLTFYAEQGEKFSAAVEQAFANGLRRHHALDDAKANRLGWIATLPPAVEVEQYVVTIEPYGAETAAKLHLAPDAVVVAVVDQETGKKRSGTCSRFGAPAMVGVCIEDHRIHRDAERYPDLSDWPQ